MHDNCFFVGNFTNGARRGNGRLIKNPSNSEYMIVKTKELMNQSKYSESQNPSEILEKFLLEMEDQNKLHESKSISNQVWEEPYFVQYSLEIPSLITN